jgi:cobalt/nickel transport system permease protein
VSRHRRPTSFLERTTDGLRGAMEHVAYAEETTAASGLLQPLDPRVKLSGLLLLVVATTMARTVAGIATVSAVAVALAVCSRLSLSRLASSVWMGALIFSAVVALPACVLTPGRVLAEVPVLHWPVTAQGLTTAAYLVLRVETAATLAALLVLTTPWAHVLKATRSLRVPSIFVVVLAMTYRYVLLLLETAHEMFESRRSRLVGRMNRADSRRLAAATAGVLLGRTMQLGNDVYLAMHARGFRGDVQILDGFRMRPRDWAAAFGFGVLTAGAVWIGR